MGRNRIDLVGRTFGRLKVLEFAGQTDLGKAKWKVRCQCGTEFIAVGSNIMYGNTRSCGCYRSEYLRSRNKR